MPCYSHSPLICPAAMKPYWSGKVSPCTIDHTIHGSDTIGIFCRKYGYEPNDQKSFPLFDENCVGQFSIIAVGHFYFIANKGGTVMCGQAQSRPAQKPVQPFPNFAQDRQGIPRGEGALPGMNPVQLIDFHARQTTSPRFGGL